MPVKALLPRLSLYPGGVTDSVIVYAKWDSSFLFYYFLEFYKFLSVGIRFFF